MASEEDQEVFEITDFTTTTEWERFIARIEEVIHEWKLSVSKPHVSLKKDDISNGTWKRTTEEICFADTRFNMVHHCLCLEDADAVESPEEPVEEPYAEALSDMMSMENDFPCRAHCLARWYGIREFVVLSPIVYADAITSESRAKLLLSSLCIAVNNTNCAVPMFLQMHQLPESFYIGICEKSGVRTNYEMVHLKKVPSHCTQLSGLIDVFKGKLQGHFKILEPVMISVRFTYILHDWTEFAWPQQPPDMDIMMGDIGITKLGELPFGAGEDPVRELHLSAIWPCLLENMIVESECYSDLDPLQAPVWTLKIQMVENPQCLLDDFVTRFLDCNSSQDPSTLQASNRLDTTDSNYSQPLDRLTETLSFPVSVPSVSQARQHLASYNNVIAAGQLQNIMYFLFPDANDQVELPTVTDGQDKSSIEPNVVLKESLVEAFRNFKSAPPDSLTFKLAVCLCHMNHAYNGVAAIMQMWQEFILEVRYRWDIAFLIPGLDPGAPNLGCCLLHQKLQMLNCCINRKRSRETQQRKTWSSSHQGSISDDERCYESSSEEEFFECDEKTASLSESKNGKLEQLAKDAIKTSSVSSNTSLDASFKDSLPHQPDGRLRRCGQLKLLHSDKPLYIPITQEPTPMTEDLLEEHAEVLVQLGTDAEGAQLRAKMQSASLLSDMEAFKAANPTCCLEDFVRWYSPRDWIVDGVNENGTKKAHLSSRMLIPGNVWVEAWQTSKPVPSRRQKRLFDDTTEAEKIFHWMASLTPGQIVMHCMPMLIHAALITLSKTEDDISCIFPTALEEIAERATKVMRAPHADPNKYYNLIGMISSAETLVAQARSLQTKFLPHQSADKKDVELNKLVQDLLQKPEVRIPGGIHHSLGPVIHRLFVRAQKAAHLIIDDSPVSELPPKEPKARSRSGSISSLHPAISDFPKPAGREYILRTTVPRPALYSVPTAQRMFCVLQQDDVRLAGAFSEDTTFH